jgi:hypothetical protein
MMTFFNLDSIVNNHTYNLAGNIGLSQFEELVSTPISHSIPNKIIRKIQSNKFVDFASLLPNMALSMSHQDHFTLTVNSKNHLSLVPSTNSKRIHNIDCWRTAFLRFVAIYSATYPHFKGRYYHYTTRFLSLCIWVADQVSRSFVAVFVAQIWNKRALSRSPEINCFSVLECQYILILNLNIEYV